ncbi:betaine/proline/choline family ABC transporter ATP-binding protein [Tissierella sp. MSJ-40]|uniref:Quaternary amine transport ATP-binding protein n=1 Tax=Tissierella simiarum TaxID=2841534 RepID=A0ABS6E2F3_9FIRM|nr:betaine/proline/choline family ABC transporter ATP-binding protein [Tissierella simiarum]MBU5436969.1 betaine/proline/choline family ABC transporter ATP-binding protein [Tissierella simiarum]
MIQFENVSKVYEDGFEALKDINFKVEEGELLVLIGPSGCGKTTTMKMINRLIEPTSGTVYIKGKPIKSQNPVDLRRDIGYVIQQIGLFPHMTIGENVSLIPKLKKQDPEEYMKKVDELLNMVGLNAKVYKKRYPKELSGGQQQRVGVVRALAADPSIILMDEPFSALDPISREQLQDELVKLQEEINKTIVFVTHDMDEALKIADRVCIMKNGQIVQLDTPERILRHPANDFVRDFIGENRLNELNENNFPPIEEVMTKAITIKPMRGLAESNKVLNKNKVDSLIVVDNNDVFLGVASAWDIYRNFENEDMVVKDVMKNDYAYITIYESLEKALTLIKESKKGYVLVLDEKHRVKGVITNGSLVRLFVDEFTN